MKHECRDPLHVENGTPEFYPKNKSTCRKCLCRRSLAEDKNHKLRIAAARERLGITTSTKPEESPAEHDFKLRALETKYAALTSQPERIPVQVSTSSGWNGAVDSFLKRPTLWHRNGLRKLA